MEKNRPHCEKEDKTSFDNEILDAILAIPGVAEVTRCVAKDAGLSSTQEEQEYDIELGLAIEYKSSIPDIHRDIVKRLEEDVQASTGMRARSVSLCIEDIHGLPCE